MTRVKTDVLVCDEGEEDDDEGEFWFFLVFLVFLVFFAFFNFFEFFTRDGTITTEFFGFFFRFFFCAFFDSLPSVRLKVKVFQEK